MVRASAPFSSSVGTSGRGYRKGGDGGRDGMTSGSRQRARGEVGRVSPGGRPAGYRGVSGSAAEAGSCEVGGKPTASPVGRSGGGLLEGRPMRRYPRGGLGTIRGWEGGVPRGRRGQRFRDSSGRFGSGNVGHGRYGSQSHRSSALTDVGLRIICQNSTMQHMTESRISVPKVMNWPSREINRWHRSATGTHGIFCRSQRRNGMRPRGYLLRLGMPTSAAAISSRAGTIYRPRP